MRKAILLIVVLMTTVVVRAQEVIEMERTGSGSYVIGCSINGASMKMILDTGASEVSLSSTAARYLLQNGYLKDKDLLRLSTATIADGSTVSTQRVILRDVAIGSVHIKNVQASVSESQEAPLLLGMSAIQSLGTVTIDGNHLIIHKTTYTKDDVARLEGELENLISNGNLTAALNNLLKINQAVGLSAKNAKLLAECYYAMELYEDCLGVCAFWAQTYGNEDTDGQEEMCGLIANSFYNNSDYTNAIPFYESLLQMKQGDASSASYTQYCLAQCYFFLDDLNKCLAYIKPAASTYRRLIGVSIADIQNGKVSDKNLGEMFLLYGACYLKGNQQRAGLPLIVIAARCGDEYSRQYCKENHIRY